MTGMSVGTPAYMSPEQAQGRNAELDGRSDQFALGLILAELITLSPVRAADNIVQALYMAQKGKRSPLAPVDPAQRVPRELRAVVQGGLRILEKIAAMDHDALRQRPRLTLLDVPVLLWRALLMPARSA